MLKKPEFVLSLVITTSIFLTSCASTSITKSDLEPGDGKSGVLVYLPFYTPAPLEIVLAGYAESNESEKVQLTSDFKELGPSEGNGRYFFGTVKPGRYLFKSLTQQTYWSTCFNEKTFGFEVMPDSVTFIGEYDARVNAANLSLRAVQSGDLTARSGQYRTYFDDIIAPTLTAPTTARTNAAREFLAKTGKGITVPLVTADLTPLSFLLGKKLAGKGKVCGRGYGTHPSELVK